MVEFYDDDINASSKLHEDEIEMKKKDMKVMLLSLENQSMKDSFTEVHSEIQSLVFK